MRSLLSVHRGRSPADQLLLGSEALPSHPAGGRVATNIGGAAWCHMLLMCVPFVPPMLFLGLYPIKSRIIKATSSKFRDRDLRASHWNVAYSRIKHGSPTSRGRLRTEIVRGYHKCPLVPRVHIDVGAAVPRGRICSRQTVRLS